MRQLLFTLRLLLFAVCFLNIASTARAEMLLAEITYTAPEPVSPPASFNFGVGNRFITSPPPIFHNWTEIIPAFPYTSTADPATVAAFDRLLTTAGGEDGVDFGLTNGPYAPPRASPIATFSLDRAFVGAYAEVGLTATRYAPPIAVPYALQNYALTAIERSVTARAQTIRIYGFAVPEPAAWLLAVLGGLLHVSTWRSSSGCGRPHRRCHTR